MNVDSFVEQRKEDQEVEKQREINAHEFLQRLLIFVPSTCLNTLYRSLIGFMIKFSYIIYLRQSLLQAETS